MLKQCKSDYPDAGHHCWAYLFGNPASPTSVTMSDDGEPSGTAGKPILNVLQHKDVGDVMVVVSRYFGGTKLGAGGLVRAYSASTKLTLDVLALTQHVARVNAEIEIRFAHEAQVRHALSNIQGAVNGCVYTDHVTLAVSFPKQALPTLQALCASLSGQIRKT